MVFFTLTGIIVWFTFIAIGLFVLHLKVKTFFWKRSDEYKEKTRGRVVINCGKLKHDFPFETGHGVNHNYCTKCGADELEVEFLENKYIKNRVFQK